MLKLSAGDYFMNILDTDASAKIVIDVSGGEVKINVVSELCFDQQTKVEISGAGTDQVSFATLQHHKVQIGQKSVIRGTLIAPDAEVHFDRECKFKGTVYADKITVDAKVAFYHHNSSAFFKESVDEEEAVAEAPGVEAVAVAVPDYELAQNYPNPFNPSTTISFVLPEAGEVRLAIYNLSGQLVKQLVAGEMSAGRHSLVWDATDERGGRVASGMHFYARMSIGANGKVGIGADAPITKLEVNDDVSGSNLNPATYVAIFRNTHPNSGDQQGVLQLEFDSNLANNPGNGNWILFVQNNTTAGRIENSNDGNVQYETNGADYAELLERVDHAEQIADGEVVGVFGGKISKRTEGADWVMAISDQAAVLGNAVYDSTEEFYNIVSFIGQVPVQVRGKVAKGDYIVASGLNDGTAIAVSLQEITPEQGRLIVGRAWEAKDTEEVKRVNTVVGLPEAASTTMALARQVESQQDKIAALEPELAALKSQKRELASQNSAFEKHFAQIEMALEKMNAAEGKFQFTSTK